MRPTDNIENAISKLNLKPDADLGERTIRDAIAAQEKCTDTAQSRISTWRTIVKNPITKFSIAAAIMVTAGILFYKQTGSIDGASVAWADVQKTLSVFRPHSYKEVIKYKDDEKAINIKFYIRNLYGRREERSYGEIYIFDLSKSPNECLVLDPQKKLGVKFIYTGSPVQQDFDMLRYSASMAQHAQPLGQQVVDGRKAIGFYNSDPNNNFTFWVDPVSHLPIRVELLRYGDTFIMNEFEYVNDFDPNLFSTDIPDGYKVETKIQDCRPVEPKEVIAEAVISGLNHTAYTVEKLQWMEKLSTIETLDPLGSRAKVYVTGIQSNNENMIIIVQGNYYDLKRMVWIPKQQLVFESATGIKFFTHPNGQIYAQRFLESFATAKPEFFDVKKISAERFTMMIVMPNGVVLSLSGNKQLSNDQLKEFAESLKEVKS